MTNRFDRLPHLMARQPARRRRYLASGDWAVPTLARAFRDAVIRDPAQQWIFDLDGDLIRLTLADLAPAAEGFGRMLAAAGGTGVGIALPNSPGAFTAFHGTVLAGLVAMPISMREGTESGRHLLGAAGVDHLVIGEHDDLRAGWGPVRVWRADPAGRIRPDRGTAPQAALPADADDGVHVLACTSGSTSVPKIVLHTDAELMAESRSLARVFGAWGTLLVPAPVGHITGILHLLTLPLVRPGGIVSMDRWDPARAIELCREHGAEATAGTSMYYHSMEKLDERLGGLRGGIAGGGPVTPALVRRLNERGIRLVRSYGSTEHPTISQSTEDDPVEVRAATDGALCAGCEVRIVGPDGQQLPAGASGEIYSRGPDTMAGYLDPDLDAEYLDADGWLRTGDIGFLDEDGRLTIADRVKDIVIPRGRTSPRRRSKTCCTSGPSSMKPS